MIVTALSSRVSFFFAVVFQNPTKVVIFNTYGFGTSNLYGKYQNVLRFQMSISSFRICFLCAPVRPLDCYVKSTSLAASQPRGNVTNIENVAMCGSRIMNPPPPLSPLLAFRSFSSFPFVSFFLQKFSARVFRWRVAATRSRLFGPGPVFFFL